MLLARLGQREYDKYWSLMDIHGFTRPMSQRFYGALTERDWSSLEVKKISDESGDFLLVLSGYERVDRDSAS